MRFKPGDGVVYRSHRGATPEDGVVVRHDGPYVFVRYRGDETAKATRPEDLELLVPRPHPTGYTPPRKDQQ